MSEDEVNMETNKSPNPMESDTTSENQKMREALAKTQELLQPLSKISKKNPEKAIQMEEEILEKIQDDDTALSYFFNNFWTKLPYSYRRLRQDLEQIKRAYLDPPGPKRRDLTLADIYKAIDASVEELELDISKYQEWQAKMGIWNWNAEPQEVEEMKTASKELHQYSIPVYIDLRKKGWTRHDLVG